LIVSWRVNIAWIIFTSQHAVKYFIHFYSQELLQNYQGKICALGLKTAKFLKQNEIEVDLIPESYSAKGIIQAFEKIAPTSVYIPKSDLAEQYLESALIKMGFQIVSEVLYKTSKQVKDFNSSLEKKVIKSDVITFTSPSAVNNFVAMVKDQRFLQKTVACIGPTTAEAAKKAGFTQLIIPERYTIDDMVRCIAEQG